MTVEEELIYEASKRGYLSASVIKPAHLEEKRTEIIIPEGVQIKMDGSGNLTYQTIGTNNTDFREVGGNMSWMGIIYFHRTQEWAEIVTIRNTSLVGRYIKVLRDNLGGNRSYYKIGDYLKVLENPDSDKVCHEVEHAGTLNLTGPNNRIKQRDVELMPVGWSPYTELKERMYKDLFVFPTDGVCWQVTEELYTFLCKKFDQHNIAKGTRGLAWSKNGFWGVEGSSAKPEYHISQLEPFFRGYTAGETTIKIGDCQMFPEKWFIRWGNQEQFRIIEAHMNTIVPKAFEYATPLHSTAGTTYEHWYVGIDRTPIDHTEITFEQFNKYVLTHTDKNQLTNNLNLNQDGKSRRSISEHRESSNNNTKGESCKVQRLNISVTGRDSVRGTGIKRTGVKIQIGSGHLPN